MSEPLTERLHVMVDPATRSDIRLAARYLGVNESTLIRNALAADPTIPSVAQRAREAGLTTEPPRRELPPTPPAIPGLSDDDIRPERQLVSGDTPRRPVVAQ